MEGKLSADDTLDSIVEVCINYSHLILNLLTVTPPFLNRHENAHFELKWL